MQTKDINDIKIKPVVHLALEPTEILGYDYFPTLLYALKDVRGKQH